jgi:hypothetical protein
VLNLLAAKCNHESNESRLEQRRVIYYVNGHQLMREPAGAHKGELLCVSRSLPLSRSLSLSVAETSNLRLD